MNPTFWRNTIWYVLLGITSVIAIILIIKKPDHRKFNIAFTFTVLGLVYSIESALMGLYGGAYSYYPKISANAFLDTVMGNHFSQVSIATTLVLLAIYKLSTKWIFVSAAIYYLIELLFLELGIYEHHWYKTWLTFLGIIVLALLVKRWYHRMLNLPRFWMYYLTLFFAVQSSYGLTRASFIYGKFRMINFNVYPDVFKDNFVLIHIPFLIVINIMISVYRLKPSWIVKCIVFISLFFIQFLLTETGIMTIRPGWFLIITSIDVLSCYLFVVIMDRLLKSGVRELQ
jgi:hypothetical protein